MERLEIYKCEECGLVVEVTTGCDCTPTCCGKEMKRMQPQTAEYKFEKHVPYPEAMDGGTRVLVGKETAHPMTEEHYIVWIEVVSGSVSMRRRLRPGEPPEAFFEIPFSDNLVAREYCNKHGLWKTK